MSAKIASLRQYDDETIKMMLEGANPIVLKGLLYHATGDEEVAATKIGEEQWAFSVARNVTDPADIELLRRKAFDLLKAYITGTATPPGPEMTPRLRKAIELAAGEEVADSELSMHFEMLSLDPTPKGWQAEAADHLDLDFQVLVIGAGLAGTNAAIQLKASGIPFVVLEKHEAVGGTWFKNTYPGARVDWPSSLYSHSYGVDFPFRYAFAPQKHNEEYVNWCVDRHDIRANIRLGVRVESMHWDENAGKWVVRTRESDGSTGVYRANAVLSAIGFLERPAIPKIPGMDSFRGKLFHTTGFDHSVDYSDKKVVVLGTGASGMQMVPELADMVGQLTVLQRTPSWVFPSEGYRDELPGATFWLNQNVPGYTNWTRFIYAWNLGDHGIYDQFLVDPEWEEPNSVNKNNHELRQRLLAYLREKLKGRDDLIEMCTPDYPVFGTRPVIDNGWYDALREDKVRLVPAGAVRLTAEGVVASNGEEIPADVIVMATGFQASGYFGEIEVVGRAGMKLSDIWAKDGPRAFWGVTVPHMPNLFMIHGPNGNPANLGLVQYSEWAIGYFLKLVQAMVENGWKSFEVREDVYYKFNAELDQRLSRLVSMHPRAHVSYYTNEFGRSSTQSPWRSAEVYRFFDRLDSENYRIEPESKDDPTATAA